MCQILIDMPPFIPYLGEQKTWHEMINLEPSIATIEKLLAEESEANITYAALECRLTIEQICYERLRLVHDYISNDDLKGWQPREVVNTLIQEVDVRIASDATFSISSEPTPECNSPMTAEDFAAIEFTSVGSQVGFNPNKLRKLWNALANLALHVNIPKNKDATVVRYGDPGKVKAKVVEALDEIKKINTGTLMLTGLGEEISFECRCGTKNKRKSGLLRDRQIVNCINPECYESFDYTENLMIFEPRGYEVICQNCNEKQRIPSRLAEKKLKAGQHIPCDCIGCGETIFVKWRLMQVQK